MSETEESVSLVLVSICGSIKRQDTELEKIVNVRALGSACQNGLSKQEQPKGFLVSSCN